MPQTIGIDLGGTNVRAAVTTLDGRLSNRHEETSRAHGEPEVLIDQLVGLIKELMGESRESVSAVGVGVPGIHDSVTGTVYQSPHFPRWNNFPLREQLQQRLDIPVLTDNDANMWALGEARHGAARGKTQALCLTLGTGIGGGLIIDGDLYHGDRGFAGEIGHMTIEAQGARCPCGNRGCWELYASAQGIARLISETKAREMSAADLGEAADAGDSKALEIWQRFGRALGMGVASLVNVLGIHTVVIGGGLSRSWRHFAETTHTEFGRRSYRECSKITNIVPAQLGDDAGIIGAGTAALQRLAATEHKPLDPVP